MQLLYRAASQADGGSQLREVWGSDEVHDQTDVGHCGGYSRANRHPESFAICEAIVETVLDTEGGNCDDIDDICKVNDER